MTKEEFFDLNYLHLEGNMEERGCEYILCGNCYLWNNKTRGCSGSNQLKKDFVIFKRKKKLEKLLS